MDIFYLVGIILGIVGITLWTLVFFMRFEEIKEFFRCVKPKQEVKE